MKILSLLQIDPWKQIATYIYHFLVQYMIEVNY
ncbi:hypothetical protein FHS14_005752 [Paenibacillus baekrokdamisoli]|nr:hypothetical protein [Paenibacillus baekrokdamisoli]